MTYIQAFHAAYLAQQGITDLTADCGVAHEQLELLYEDAVCWIILNHGDSDGRWLLVVHKRLAVEQGEPYHEMETFELPSRGTGMER